MSLFSDVSDIRTTSIQRQGQQPQIDQAALERQIEERIMRKVSESLDAQRRQETKVAELEAVGARARTKFAEALKKIKAAYYQAGKAEGSGQSKTSSVDAQIRAMLKTAEEMGAELTEAAGEGAMNESLVIEALIESAAQNPEVAANMIADETGNTEITPEEVEAAAQGMAAEALGTTDENAKTASAYGRQAVEFYRQKGFHRSAQILLKSAEVRVQQFRQHLAEQQADQR